jgi:2-oxoglutarate ferredoxin oxidoreductase subunit beta
MTANLFDKTDIDIAWCPGCGNFKILEMLKAALQELGLTPQQLVVVSGIGQAPKTPQYFNTNMFNGLHGRSLPVATAVKVSNPELTVIAEGGDGDMYGEGGNHFLHAIRRNPDIAHLVHNNMVYGLTKGQASPTSQTGFKTPIQIDGVINEPVNPIAVAVAQNASFVARAFAGDVEQTKAIVQKAIQHKGYALVDILQPCVTFNKTNTFKWFKAHSYYLDETHDPTDRAAAFGKAIEKDRFALGIIYSASRPAFEQQQPVYASNALPLWKRSVDMNKIRSILNKL